MSGVTGIRSLGYLRIEATDMAAWRESKARAAPRARSICGWTTSRPGW